MAKYVGFSFFFFFTLLFLLVLLTENVFVLCFVLFVQAETLGMTYSINAMYKYSEARTQQIQGIPVTLESALKGTISAPRHWLTQRREKFAKGTTSSSTLMGRQSGKTPQSPLRLGNVSNLCNPAEYGFSRTEPRASRLRQKNEKIMRRSNAQTGWRARVFAYSVTAERVGSCTSHIPRLGLERIEFSHDGRVC